jgi:hypothetical protein
MRKKPQEGDLIYIDCPGSPTHLCVGMVLEVIDWSWTEAPVNTEPKDYETQNETDYRVLLSAPPETHPAQIMMRDKWVKRLLGKDKKVLDFPAKNDII